MSGSGSGNRPLVADRRYGKEAPRAAPAKTARRRRKPVPRKRRPGLLGLLSAFVRGIFRVIFGILWRLGAVTALLLGAGVFYYASTLPPIEDLVDGRSRGSVTLLDRYGETFAWRGDQFGGMVTSASVSPDLRNAVVATEDRRFWWHPGIDPQGIASAIRINLREGRGPLSGNGGSTITQQTAKLLCLGRPYDPRTWANETEYEADCRRTTLWRKVQEMVFAMAMEVSYSKEEILTIYLNRAYLGAGARGFEAASQRYFGIPASQVDAAQAGMLAGLLKAPSSFAPTASLDRAQDRAAVVVRLMEEQGYLSAAAAADALANPATLSAAAAQAAGGYFADYVMETGPEFFTRDTTEDVIIRTTLDPRIQSAAEGALLSVFSERLSEESVAEAAIVVMSADGAVRAMVGGRDVRATFAFNRATQALRQTGSSFKPFVYAAALDLGYSPFDVVDDRPITITIPGSPPWSPSNYDNRFVGPINLADALQGSRNIPTVEVAMEVGLESVRTVAEMFGISSDLAAGPAIALGASESTLIEMTGAYAGILNGGSSVTPYGMIDLSFQGDDAPVMETTGGIGERVIREEAARELTWMMYRVVEGGTGTRARIDGVQIAGKTGTTSGYRDAWFIGFSGDYVVGVWMGNDNNEPLREVTGGGLPAEIFRRTMEGVLAGQPVSPLPMSEPAPAGTPGLLSEAASDNVTSPAVDRALEEAFGQPPRPAEPATGQDINSVLNNILNGTN